MHTSIVASAIMNDDKTILAVIEPAADAQTTLERGAWLADALGARLAVVAFAYDQQLADSPFRDPRATAASRRDLLSANRQRLESLVTPFRERGLQVDIDAHWEHPLDRGVLRIVAAHRPLVVVKETHYHGLLQRAFFSNADWALVRRCASPLLLVKSRMPASSPRILAAVDPMHELDKPADLDHAILALATELATAVRGTLDVFHAFDPALVIAHAAGSLTSPIAIPVRDLTARLERAHRAALDQLLSDYSVERTSVHLEQGVAAERLVSLTRSLPADIVVMGAMSRTGISQFLIGGTTERVLDVLPCDVLLVKPPGFAVPAE
jgi:universal stress protein E